MQTTITETSEAYKNFINSLDSEVSRSSYKRSFPQFMRFCKIDSYEEMLPNPAYQETRRANQRLSNPSTRRPKIAPASIATYSAAIAHFYEMNDVTVNWKKLKKFKGRLRSVVEDIPYTRQQIKTLIE